MDRTVYGVCIHPEELDDLWIQAASEQQIDAVILHPAGGGQADQSFERFLSLMGRPGFRSSVSKLRAEGIRLETAAHVVSWMLPRTLFNAHPEWFRMNEAGERTADWNLCPSCGAAMARLSDRAETLVGAIPADGHRYHLWPDDAAGAVCHCPRCAGLSAADQALMIAHAILAGLRRKDPKARLSYLAYHDSMEQPELIPEPEIFLEYAPMDRDMNRPLADPLCRKNRKQVAPLAALLGCFGRENATALDYWYDNSMQSGWKKPPARFHLNESVLRADRAFYRQMGFPYVLTFACFLGADYRALYGPGPDFSQLTND